MSWKGPKPGYGLTPHPRSEGCHWRWRDDAGQVRLRPLCVKAMQGSDRQFLPQHRDSPDGLRHVQPTNIENRSIIYDLQQAGMIDADRVFTARGLAFREAWAKRGAAR